MTTAFGHGGMVILENWGEEEVKDATHLKKLIVFAVEIFTKLPVEHNFH